MDPDPEKWCSVNGAIDQSSCHKAMAENALDASAMNVKPGGKQPKMRDTVWAGRVGKVVVLPKA